MSRRSKLPADGSLPDSQLIHHSPALQKLLLRPSKDVLCDLALEWLENPTLGKPHPPDEDEEMEDDEDEEQLDVEQLKEVYTRMSKAGGITKKAVVERIVERDWVRSSSCALLKI